MGKHSLESKGKFRKKTDKRRNCIRKQVLKKNHICLCNASSCPDKTSISWLSSSSSSSSTQQLSPSTSTPSSSVKPKDNQNFITFTSDPLYVRFMEYSVLKKRIAAIEQRENSMKM